MNRLFSFLIAAASVLVAAGAHAAALVDSSISSRFLVAGEQSVLEVIYPGDDYPQTQEINVPQVDKLVVRPGDGWVRRVSLGKRWQYFFPITVVGYYPGDYTIPPVEFKVGGETVRSAPTQVRILEEDKLKWSKVTVGRSEIRYVAGFYAMKGNPYVGEKQAVEIKVYLPAEQNVEDWGIPDFERDGLSVWRFQPQQLANRMMTQRPLRASLANRPFHAISYPSTMSTNRVGKSTLGPAKIKIQAVAMSQDGLGGAYYQPVELTVPPVEFESKPLPPGAPDGFANAIGQFDMKVWSDETEVREGDPVTIHMSVSGSGNLDALEPPKPVDEEGWKLYDTSSAERGEERRELSGQVDFRMFMRPLRVQKSIPPFRLVYFDPAKNTYETLSSDAIPLTVMPSTAPAMAGAAVPQAMPMPLEEMTDILGIIKKPAGLLFKQVRLPLWIWQVIPGLLVLVLLFRIARLKVGPRLHKNPEQIAREREWREVERAPDQMGDFYRSVGHFIERWLGDKSDPVIAQTLAKRDEVCFRQETAEAKIDRAERQQVLKQLRRFALPLVLGFLALTAQSGFGQQAAPAAAADPAKLYDEGHYGDAAKAWLDSGSYDRLPADTLFNIGNAAYRLGSPGEAALYYRRALLRDNSHPEARQNLRFLERKFGSITIQRPEYQHALARVPLEAWKGCVWAAIWMVVLGVLIFPATRPGAGIRTLSIAAFVTAPLLAAAGIVAWHFYPDDARFAPMGEQVVVVADTAAVRTDAARSAPKVIDAPAGSLCRLITKSGGWAYVAFTNESRGWLPLAEIEPIVPEGQPAPPKLRPAQKSENNA